MRAVTDFYLRKILLLPRECKSYSERVDCGSHFYYNIFMKEHEQLPTERVLISNRKARHEYEILDAFEAGIVLKGAEVKSIRAGNANLQDSYAYIKAGEVWLAGMHISPYEHTSFDAPDPVRERKLLLHRKEIRKLIGKTSEKGLTLIPLKVYLNRGHAKVEIAVCRGRRSYDKRQAIAKRETDREMRRAAARRSD
jgi:SsrA-binding protein